MDATTGDGGDVGGDGERCDDGLRFECCRTGCLRCGIGDAARVARVAMVLVDDTCTYSWFYLMTDWGRPPPHHVTPFS